MRWSSEQIEFDLLGDLTEGNVATLAVGTPVGELMVMADVVQIGRCMIVTGLHMHGVGVVANEVSPENLRVVARAFMQEFGYDDIVVEGGVRTTGANPGRRPRRLRFTRRPGASPG